MDGNGQADISVGAERWAPGDVVERSKWESFPYWTKRTLVDFVFSSE